MAKAPELAKEPIAPKKDPEPIMSMSDPKWTQYVLSKLEPNEKFGDRPKCDGLRRLFGVLVGEITASMSTVVDSAKEINRDRATVSHYLSYTKEKINKDSTTIYTVSDCADVSVWNTANPYCRYPTASACTIAEGRCLKKALHLVGVATVEEMTVQPSDMQDSSETTSKMKTTQKNLILSCVERLDMNGEALLKQMFDNKQVNSLQLSELNYSSAQQVINLLQRYTDGPDNHGLIVPDNLLK